MYQLAIFIDCMCVECQYLIPLQTTRVHKCDLVYLQWRDKTFQTVRPLIVSDELSALVHVHKNGNRCLIFLEYHTCFHQIIMNKICLK